MPRPPIFLALSLIACSLTGCATAGNIKHSLKGDEAKGFKSPYAGTVWDAVALGTVLIKPELLDCASPGEQAYLVALTTVYLPFAIVDDTLSLPWTVTATVQNPNTFRDDFHEMRSWLDRTESQESKPDESSAESPVFVSPPPAKTPAQSPTRSGS